MLRVAKVAGAVVALLLVLISLPYWHIPVDAAYIELIQPMVKSKPDSIEDRRTKLTHFFGADVPSKPLESKVISSIDTTAQPMFEPIELKHRREELRIKSRRGDWITAYLLLPADYKGGKLPCVVCVPGHGKGLDLLVGFQDQRNYDMIWDGTPQDYALYFLRKGYAVCAFEQFGIGHSVPNSVKALKDPNHACMESDYVMRLNGRTTMAERVADARTVIDYAQSRKEIDPNRIAMMGVSAGGTTTLMTSAVDSRIKCAIVVSYFTHFKDSLFKVGHCLCNYAPGLVHVADVPEIAELIAPRCLFVEHSTKDNIYPFASAELAYNKICNSFDSKSIEFLKVKHPHCSFSGPEAVAFLGNHL